MVCMLTSHFSIRWSWLITSAGSIWWVSFSWSLQNFTLFFSYIDKISFIKNYKNQKENMIKEKKEDQTAKTTKRTNKNTDRTDKRKHRNQWGKRSSIQKIHCRILLAITPNTQTKASDSLLWSLLLLIYSWGIKIFSFNTSNSEKQ